ncbi:MAG: hypothetical protein U5M51_02815 [Emticicia sp.]|nr:hypothetical protein [Emticicia sp.]
MKNIFFTYLLLLSSFSFAQSFEANPRFMTVPKYANQGAITTAIPSPTEGMLVYNIALDQYAFYNGTAWSNIPSSSGGGGSGLGIPVYNNLAAVNAIASPAAGWLVYNAEQEHVMIYTSTGWKSLSRSWLLNPTTNKIRYMRGQVQLGDATSTLPGKLVINNTFVGATPPPSLAFTSTTKNIVRFTDGASSLIQTTNYSATQATAKVEWHHLQEGRTQTLTPMMSIQGNGNARIEGFVKLGGTAADVPAIKTKLLTATTASSATTSIAHGLTASKIIGVNAVIENGTNYVLPNDGATIYRVSISGANAQLTSVPAALQAKNAKIYITYIE